MKNGTFIPVTRVQSRSDVKSDGKARFGDNNPTPHAARNRRGQVHQRQPRAHRKLKEKNTLKHEYTDGELAELKKIYDESGEAGLDVTEMRALRKAGLLTQGLPAKPSKRDLILAHCKNRIDQGQTFDGKETAETLGISQKTVGNIISQLRKEGLLPAFDKHSPRKNTTSGKKKETIMTVASKPVANKEEPMSQELTANKETAPEKQCENPRAIISNALTGIFDAISALQRTAFQTNDKVVYGFATKLLNGELMDIKANYSKDAK